MRGIVFILLAGYALDNVASGDVNARIITDDLIKQCPTYEPPSSNATLLKNPSDCTTYYVCVHGYPVLRPCPPGLYFNDDPKEKVCDWPRNVKCEVVDPTDDPTKLPPKPTKPATTTTKPTTTTTKKPAPTKPPPPPTTTTKKPAPTKPPPPPTTTTKKPAPTRPPPPPTTTRKPSPTRPPPPPTTTTKKPAPTRPPPPPSTTTRKPAPTRPPPPPSTTSRKPSPTKPPTEATNPPTLATTRRPVGPPDSCPTDDPQEGETIIFPNPDDESSFYECKPTLRKCPAGLVFNNDLKVCDWPGNVNGGTQKPPSKPTRPPRPTTTATTKKPANPSESCPAADPQDGQATILPNPEDPHSFFICSWGVPHLQNCSAGLVFNNDLKVCVWPSNDNGGNQNPTSRPTRTTRAATRPTRTTRAATRPTTTITVKPTASAVICPPTDPQDAPAYIIANPDDQHSFYICSWGVPYLHKCAANLVFRPSIRVCA